MPSRNFAVKEIFASSDNVQEWPSSPEEGWTPTEGVPYRNANISDEAVADGWPYNQIVKSQDFNEIMRQLTGVVHDIETCGIARWSQYTNYEEGAVCLYNGVCYKAEASSGPDVSGGAVTPGTNVSKWVVTPVSWRSYNYRGVSSSANALPNDLVYCVSGGISVNLPAISDAKSETRVKVVCGAGVYPDSRISINAASGQAIADASTNILYLDSPYSFVELYYDHANSIWRITSYGIGTSQEYKPKAFTSRAIFEVFWSVSSEPPTGAMSLCYNVTVSGGIITNNAGVISNCDVKYPDFWREILRRKRNPAKIRVVSIEDWTAEYIANGSCAAFVVNETTKSVRLPCIKNYLLASSDVSKQQQAEIPNIKGNIGYFPVLDLPGQTYWDRLGDPRISENGPFKPSSTYGEKNTAGHDEPAHGSFSVNFDASRVSSVYKDNAPTVRPPSSTAILYIQVANTDAGSVNSGTSGSTEDGWYKIDGNGFVEEGGTANNVTTTGINVTLPYPLVGVEYQVQLTGSTSANVYVSQKSVAAFIIKSASGNVGTVDWYVRAKLN